MSDRRLFHLVPEAALRALLRDGSASLAPPSLAAEGFVHLSFAEQLAGTLAVHFADRDAPVLVEVDPALVADALQLEPSRGGALFPHVHRALARHELVRAWRLAPGPGLPELGSRPEDDRPGGRSLERVLDPLPRESP